MSESRERDLILAPNEYAYILDETKGHVIAYIGPHKTSLANTDRPVTYDQRSRRYQRGTLEDAITPFPFAEEGWYVVLENPAKEGDDEHPKTGPNNLPKLISGRKVNLPGPVTFPLWPGQVARVIQGHHLRSNQYLVVRVYNEDAARENWAQAVIKPQRPDAEPVESLGEAPDLTMGKLLVIRGTDVSFYIPPTGVEVVPDAESGYVRAAVTLERLEYCILLDEDGNKRFIRGPAVVFPEPTETFVEKQGSRKFKAIELSELTGIYLKVIAPYTDENGVSHKEGEELFLTGKEQMIYFPRPEHAIIKYGNQDIHHSVAIPAGNALYVLNRLSGEVSLERGPAMFLPDPRKEVVVRRVLPLHLVAMMYPGNQEALEYNRRLLQLARPELEGYVADREVRKKAKTEAPRQEEAPAAPRDFVGDELQRSQTYSKPRTITLDTRYEGAVSLDVWTGYAVLIVGKRGQRNVVVGPASYLLEYDESPEMVELSTGTPKTDEELFRTVYLRVLNNTVSDVVVAETADLCQVRVQLSYRVNFEGDPERWFNVENYVKFLTDHMRSMLRNAIKAHGLETFYQNAIAVVRDALLGAPQEGKRAGRRFEENGMHVYDVEVLDVLIGENHIADLLMKAQHHAVQQAIELAAEQRRLEATRKSEEIKQQIAEAVSTTTLKELGLKSSELDTRAALTAQEIRSSQSAEMLRLKGRQDQQDTLDKLHDAELSRQRSLKEMELELAQKALAQKLEELQAEVQAVVSKASAVSPDLVAALQAFSDRALAEKMAETMAPLAILGGKSIGEVFAGLLKDTPLESVLKRGNGETLALKPGS